MTKLGTRIGSGGFGDVYDFRSKNSNVVYKVVRPANKSTREQEKVETVYNYEIAASKLCRHPNVIRLIACIPSQHAFLLEKADSDLGSFLSEPSTANKFSFAQKVQILLDVALALDHLHSREHPIVHHIAI